ncbi:MAG: GTP-binding protein [Candidatus Omnitrophica bacterium]|nr:GTP-binding protein [Candidatus Omnitrophota bacterium]
MLKDTLKIVITGHVDHGKSTMIGRLLLDTGSLPKERIEEIGKVSKDLGKEAELAHLADQLREERENSMTIDTTQTFFKSHKKNYVIIDAPGHVELIKNMLTGASLAQAAVLIVDTEEGIKEQTRRHAYLLSLLGLSKVIVVLNKMDIVGYDKGIFEATKKELLKFLAGIGIRPISVIPASAKSGANISKKSDKMKWYKGPCLLEALDELELDKKTVRKPLRFPVQDVYEIEGEKIIAGRVASGTIKKGQKVVVFPSGNEAKIRAVKVFGARRDEAAEGESIGLTLEKPVAIERGEFIVEKDYAPKPTNRFKGNVFWISDEPLRIGKTMTLRCATQRAKCVIEKIESRINSSTLETIEENAKELRLNETGSVVFRTKTPVVAEKIDFIEELGRFVLEDGAKLEGMGIVL